MSVETPHPRMAARRKSVNLNPLGSGVDGGGGGGDDGRMEQRISVLETANLETRDRLAKIEARMDSLASKEDFQKLRAELHESLNAQTWKIIGSCALLVAAVFFIARFVLAAPHS